MRFLFSLILSIIGVEVFAQYQEINLNNNWEFRKEGETVWYPAKVPGNIYSDLLKNHLIPDPFYGDNENKVQWVEKVKWQYQKTFDVSKKDLTTHNVSLVFKGLDTYAKVYLNDSLILVSDNMFREWVVEVKNYLHTHNNILRIIFEPAVEIGKESMQKYPYPLPGDERLFTRKSQFHYGWDFAPRLVTCGIWKDITLISWEEVKFEDCHVILNSLNEHNASITFENEVTTNDIQSIQVRIQLMENGKLKQSMNFPVHLNRGTQIIKNSIDIKDPKLWWCNGFGEPYLYHFTVELLDGRRVLGFKSMETGLRNIELVREKDKVGESFYFKLNGVPVFMKGANYIPSYHLITSSYSDQSTRIISDAVEAHMNMLRVWGGGIYEDDEFYNTCDKNGILVWQDFMFACAMYPDDEQFNQNINQEVKYQVKRLRNHSCIALWCGNNESEEGWNNWGWQKQYHINSVDSGKIWNNYTHVFQNMIPEIIDSFYSSESEKGNGKIRYISSSPKIGWGHPESITEGDSHYWGVWWGNEPFDVYKKKTGRFMSEYGFQGMPCLESVKRFVDSTSLMISALPLKIHQKQPRGFEIIKDYLLHDFRIFGELDEFIYKSQFIQAQGIRTAIESHRRAKPYCMGTLFWQLNDCWPSISWSAIDYYGTRKALYYQAKRSFDDVIISVDDITNGYGVYITSDLLKSLKGKLEIRLFDSDGKLLWWETSTLMNIDPNSSGLIYILENSIVDKFERNNLIMDFRFNGESGYMLAQSIKYLVNSVDLQLQKPELKLKVSGKNSFSISTSKPAFQVYIQIPGVELQLSDNFFDLMPGQSKKITISGKELSDELLLKFKSISLFDYKR